MCKSCDDLLAAFKGEQTPEAKEREHQFNEAVKEYTALITEIEEYTERKLAELEATLTTKYPAINDQDHKGARITAAVATRNMSVTEGLRMLITLAQEQESENN